MLKLLWVLTGLTITTASSSSQEHISVQRTFASIGHDDMATAGKGINQYCTRNYECDSGCCNWDKMVPGYGWGMCDDRRVCAWSNSIRTGQITTTEKVTQCPNQLDFGPPSKYKISVGKAFIRKRGNNMEIDRFNDGTVFYSAQKGTGVAIWVREDGKNLYVNSGLTFTETRSDAMTFNVSTSQYGRKLWNKERVLIKHPENDNGLQMRNDPENAAIVTFTKYIEPSWKEDVGPVRDRKMIEVAEKVCGSNSTCADILAGYLRPDSIEDFIACD